MKQSLINCCSGFSVILVLTCAKGGSTSHPLPVPHYVAAGLILIFIIQPIIVESFPPHGKASKQRSATRTSDRRRIEEVDPTLQHGIGELVGLSEAFDKDLGLRRSTRDYQCSEILLFKIEPAGFGYQD